MSGCFEFSKRGDIAQETEVQGVPFVVSLRGTKLSVLKLVAPASRRLSGGRPAHLAPTKSRADKETANEELEDTRHLVNAIWNY